ncbi:MAG: rhodanese-like domain-containing protein [Oscillospiraceae bacterium]|jgi:rhodanese-related sulfurtransferase|nr:rhodanese-like domain-containing protein [Oscillospiraceae bacterium]
MMINSKRRLIALAIIVVMVLPLVPMTAAAANKLATPVLIQKGSPSYVKSDGAAISAADLESVPESDRFPGNPYQHTQFRSFIFEPVEGATGYTVYAYATKADAVADTNRVAVAENVGPTAGSTSTGGTMATATVKLEGDEQLIDVRLLQFEDIKEGATRTLPSGYVPAGLGDTYSPGDGSGDKTNLKPGQYWFRLQAVDEANPSKNSELCKIYDDGDAFSISLGPTEAKDLLEPLLAAGKLGTTPDADFRIVDLRGPAEFSDEGYIRFSEVNRYTPDKFNTTAKAEAIFGHVADKSKVTIFVFCRGGGRTVTASRHLSNAGYTNVYNMQGVVQWTNGLMYDDPTFRFRQIGNGIDGYPAPGTTADSPAGISLDEGGAVLRWYNLPRAKYNIFAFASENETDPAKAVATGTLPALPQDLTGGARDWRFVRNFNLRTLSALTNGVKYYIRVQALPEVDLPVNGYTPDTIWGAPSKLSDAAAYTPQPSPIVNATPSVVFIDGVETEFEAYIINGNNFFKLRDLALALNGSEKPFSVKWDGDAQIITLTSGEEYEPDGGEMAKGDGKSKAANPTTAKVILDGAELKVAAYNIGGNNFFKLRDLMSALDVGVTYDEQTRDIGVDTSKPYTD